MLWTALRSAVGVAVTAGVVAAADPALAQGRLDARYAVSLAGVPVGKGAWVIDIAENQFTAAASGATAGLLRVFASGQGSGASRGYIVGGNPVPATFAASITSDKKTEEIRMTLGSGDVKEFAISPELPDDPERVPVTEAHFHGVSDPMTGSLLRVPGTGNPLVPQACQRTTPIFDGRMRYNLQFAYKRMEQVKTDKGYEGPVVVCAVYFVPVAGYVPHRADDQVSGEPARHGGLAGAGRLDPRAGAVPDLDPDADRRRRDAGHAVRLGGAAARRGGRHQDAVSAAVIACGGASASQLSTAYPQDQGESGG